VTDVDRIQYELMEGPCVDSAIDDAIYNAADLETDRRWPEFGHRVGKETPVRSMLAVRLFIDQSDLIGSLNLYATSPGAFDKSSEMLANLLATHASLAVQAAQSREQAANLTAALRTSREIGMAIGILMQAQKVTEDQGFDLLRIASQRTHRKLASIAADVVQTGTLPLLTSAIPDDTERKSPA
jgi:GAF domain-containing protein